MGVNRDGPSEDLGLVYEVDDTVRNSLVTLEVSADDMILIYNRLVFGEWSEVVVDGYVCWRQCRRQREGARRHFPRPSQKRGSCLFVYLYNGI